MIAGGEGIAGAGGCCATAAGGVDTGALGAEVVVIGGGEGEGVVVAATGAGRAVEVKNGRGGAGAEEVGAGPRGAAS